MKKMIFISIGFLLLSGTVCYSQQSIAPKLVVGIVVDQMRNDYIYRYWSRFGDGGFKRLVQQGFYFKNAHYNYIPTYTGPGHSSIYTGATPRTHGIIGNAWFDKIKNKDVPCVQDTLVKPVGTDNKKAKASPVNLLSSTIGDELKMSTNKRSKVFGIAGKDRSAILPAGRAADAAFWLDETKGIFVSSTWYLQELPKWMRDFNDHQFALTYLKQGWNTLYPLNSYTSSISDANEYEEQLFSDKKTTFPYSYKEALDKNYLSSILYTPYANTLTKDAAIACLRGEQLGKDEDADLLAISFSSPDYVAHAYGPRSVEVEDIYLRLDKDLEDLLNTLDKEVGKNKYTVFLTADHGGADVPHHLMDNKISAGYIRESQLIKDIRNHFYITYRDSTLLSRLSNEQVFINEKKVTELSLNKATVEEQLAMFLLTLPGIAEAYTSKSMKENSFSGKDYRALLQNGYNHKMSGNVCIIYKPGWMDHGERGTTHGAGYNYDTHVPVIFFGAGIKKGETYSYATITQIAPTICELLRINQPNSTISEPLNGFFK